eukprot:7161743-Prymnesium_polylepis.1
MLPLLGETQQGDALDYLAYGSIDARSFLLNVPQWDYYHATVTLLEWQYLQLDLLSLRRGDGTLVRMFSMKDLAGTTRKHYSHAMFEALSKSVGLCDDFYPELCGCICVANAPALFPPVWAVFKWFLARDFRDKIRIYTKGALNLVDTVPAKLVPACYAGELKQLPMETQE